jgi:carbon storage regulator
MLSLTRKPNESIILKTSDGDVKVMIIGQRGQYVRVGIDAPQSVAILREELIDRDRQTTR